MNTRILWVNTSEYGIMRDRLSGQVQAKKLLDTGETFASRKADSKEAYEEFLYQKSVDSLTEDMERLNIC